MTNDPTRGDQSYLRFSPHELIALMEEFVVRLSRVGDRLDAYIQPRELPVPLELPKVKPND